jgi:hypothetical protein
MSKVEQHNGATAHAHKFKWMVAGLLLAAINDSQVAGHGRTPV